MPTIINIENIENELGVKVNGAPTYNHKGCKLCGELHKIEECNILLNAHHIHDNEVPTRARITLPNQLRIEMMSDGSTNVVAEVKLTKGSRFGPFEAKKSSTLNPMVTFPIKIFKFEGHDEEYYFDPRSEHFSNWMCFVSVAADYNEQNLVCYQMKDQIYYSVIRDISVGEYLKVWYAAYYAEKMGAPMLDTKMEIDDPMTNTIQSIKVEKIMNQKVAETLPARKLGADTDKTVWTCRFCKISIKNIVEFATHLQQHYKEIAFNSFVCLICHKKFSSEKSLLSHQLTIHQMSPSNNKPLILNKDDSSSSTTTSNPSTSSINSVTTTSATTQSESSIEPSQSLLDDVYCDTTDLVFKNDSLVGGQTQDQIHDESLNTLDNITLNSLNYNSMLSKMNELNEHLKFEIKDTSLNDSLNTDSLEDILCHDDENSLKANKIAQEKSIADFSLDFVDVNGIQLNQISTEENGETPPNGNLNGPPYNCDICSKDFQNLEYLIRHLKKHSGEFTCVDCFAVFTRRENYLNHACKWNPKRQSFECQYCEKEFSEQKYLNRHIQRHNQKKTCTKCRKVCDSISDLEQHVCDPESINEAKKLQEAKKFECHICKNRYSKNSNLRLHIQKCHKPKEDEANSTATTTTDDSGQEKAPQETFICYMCGETFTNQNQFKAHLVAHQPKVFACDICEKKFSRSDVFEAHKLTHQNLQVECPDCNKTFKTEMSMKKHRRLHTETHNCEYCSKTFVQKHNLEKHVNFQHANDRESYNCDKCAEVYTSLKLLKEHKLTHPSPDSKPLYCEYCNKKFTKNHLLKAHYVQNHIGRMFSCPYCTTIVKHRASIRRHLSKSHREKRVEWDNSDFIGRLVSQKTTTTTASINVATVSTSTQAQSQPQRNNVPIIIDSIVLSQPTSTTSNEPTETPTIILQTPPVEMEDIKMDNEVVETKPEEDYHSADSMLPKLYPDSNQINFNEQLEFQNIIYLKNELSDNSSTVNLDLVDKMTEYSNLDSATAKLSQFSDLTTVTTTSQELVKEQRMHMYGTQLSQSTLTSANTDNLPKFTRVVDRSNDFDMMDLQSLISPDSGMIEFSNEMTDRSDGSINSYSNNMSLQLQNVNLQGNTNIIQMTTDGDREVTLGKNAFILDDGTIVEPQEAGNVMFYVLNQS